MVDATTLIVISTIVQTIVITITLLIFVLQFRSQEKSIREASYQGLMGRYNDLIGTLADKPEVAKLMMDSLSGENAFSKEEIATWSHLLMAYGIIEEAFLLYTKKWIDEDNWLQWAAFLGILARTPMFARMQKATIGTFDPRFEKFVFEILGKQVQKAEKELTAETPESSQDHSSRTLK